MQSGPSLLCLSLRKASYLADKGQVIFGRDFKRFPSSVFSWVYQRNNVGERG